MSLRTITPAIVAGVAALPRPYRQSVAALLWYQSTGGDRANLEIIMEDRQRPHTLELPDFRPYLRAANVPSRWITLLVRQRKTVERHLWKQLQWQKAYNTAAARTA